VGSAIGFLRAPIAYEVTRSAIVAFAAFDAERVNRLIAAITADARRVVDPALAGKKPMIRVIADCRYIGQGHEIRIDVPRRRLTVADGARLKVEFERLYEQVYGLRIPNQEAEAITWSVTVSSVPAPARRASKAKPRAASQPRSRRSVYDPALGRRISVPVYWRFDLAPGAHLNGPAIIAEDETSTIVGSGFRASVNSLGYILLERVK